MYYVILNLGPKYRSGHPELLQLEKPMVMGGASIGAGGVISPPLFYTVGVKGVHKLITTIQ